jgi:BNR/Asp-box repeat
MHQAFYISPEKWIRLGTFSKTTSEIYISTDNGEHWKKKANVALDDEGVFAVSRRPGWIEREDPKSHIGPVIYAPFKGNLTRPDGSKRVGLIRFTDVFSSTVDNYDEGDLIYLDDNGSLGSRRTEWESQAVYGVDPNDPNYIIAPDIYNGRVMVSRDGGLHWNIDNNLTREVTKSKTVLLYDGHVKRMQVTRISFDPYNRNRIYVGTRDLGVILSTDGGKTWSTIPYTNTILYITNFFFKPRGDTVIVSSYGRGLWQIHTRVSLIPFAAERFCRGSRCIFRKIPGYDGNVNIHW